MSGYWLRSIARSRNAASTRSSESLATRIASFDTQAISETKRLSDVAQFAAGLRDRAGVECMRCPRSYGRRRKEEISKLMGTGTSPAGDVVNRLGPITSGNSVAWVLNIIVSTWQETTRTKNTARSEGAGKVDMKLEVVVIPVSDVDRAKRFYVNMGWRLDADFASGDWRILQVTPPGSACSFFFGKGLTKAAPGSAPGLMMIVDDIEATRAELAGYGVEVSEAFHFESGLNFIGTQARVPGPDPERRSYFTFASFNDPDGNGWLLQEIKERLPGRGVSSMDVATMTELLRETEQHHGPYETTAPEAPLVGMVCRLHHRAPARENARRRCEGLLRSTWQGTRGDLRRIFGAAGHDIRSLKREDRNGRPTSQASRVSKRSCPKTLSGSHSRRSRLRRALAVVIGQPSEPGPYVTQSQSACRREADAAQTPEDRSLHSHVRRFLHRPRRGTSTATR
jgi:catechol 2,3-dioxygenase-like lactoylglutathione lyase family enzyme